MSTFNQDSEQPGEEWTTRLDWGVINPAAHEAMLQLEKVAHQSNLPPRLIELVKIRVSQMNGCSYCLDMHTKDARQLKETEQRLYGLIAWRESPFFSSTERVALAWAESVTNIAQGISDDLYQEMCQHFADAQIIALTTAIITINAWNRWAISMRTRPGSYRPDLAH